MDNLAAILTYLMSEKGIKSAELARKTGVGQPVIYRLMTGTTENPQVLTIKPIADFFGVTLDQLLGVNTLNNPGTQHASPHELANKLTTIKTIASVLVELMPSLIDGYRKAVTANIIEEEISADLLPLLPPNCSNLLKAANQLQQLLTNKNIARD